MLRMGDLRSYMASTKIEVFRKRIEACMPSEEARLNLAKFKLDSDLADLVEVETTEENLNTWAKFIQFLKSFFHKSPTCSELFRTAEQEAYHISEDPYDYVQKMTYLYSTIKSNFPKSPLPPKENWIKMRLNETLPPYIKKQVARYMHDMIPLQVFLTELNNERLRPNPADARDAGGRVYEVTQHNPQRTNPQPSTDRPPRTTPLPPPVREDDRLTRLQESLATLAQDVQRLTRRPQYTGCPFCRTKEHNIADCPLRPARGACFDCLRENCRRGRPGCPGREGRVAR